MLFVLLISMLFNLSNVLLSNSLNVTDDRCITLKQIVWLTKCEFGFSWIKYYYNRVWQICSNSVFRESDGGDGYRQGRSYQRGRVCDGLPEERDALHQHDQQDYDQIYVRSDMHFRDVILFKQVHIHFNWYYNVSIKCTAL